MTLVAQILVGIVAALRFQAKVFFLACVIIAGLYRRQDRQLTNPVYPGGSCGVGAGCGATRQVTSKPRLKAGD